MCIDLCLVLVFCLFGYASFCVCDGCSHTFSVLLPENLTNFDEPKFERQFQGVMKVYFNQNAIST